MLTSIMDEQGSDCPCKKQRVSETDTDEESAVTGCHANRDGSDTDNVNVGKELPNCDQVLPNCDTETEDVGISMCGGGLLDSLPNYSVASTSISGIDTDTGEKAEKYEAVPVEFKPQSKAIQNQRVSHDIARIVQDTMAALAENAYIRNKEAAMNFDSPTASYSQSNVIRNINAVQERDRNSTRTSRVLNDGYSSPGGSRAGITRSDFHGNIGNSGRDHSDSSDSVNFYRSVNQNSETEGDTISDMEAGHTKAKDCDTNILNDNRDQTSSYCLDVKKDACNKSAKPGTSQEGEDHDENEPETDEDEDDSSLIIESPGFLSDSGFINLFSNCRGNTSHLQDLEGDYAQIEDSPRETTFNNSCNTVTLPNIICGMNPAGDASSAIQQNLSRSSSETSPQGDSKIKSLILDKFFKVIPCGNLGKSELSCRPSNTPFHLDLDYVNEVVNQHNINSLPPQILVFIFRYLSPCTLLRKVGPVCKYWYNWCRDQDLWKNINLMNQHKLTDVHLQQLISFSDRVVRVNLTDCRFVTNIGIKILLARCTHLQVLKLMRCFDLSDEAFKDVCDKSLCSQLRCLRLDGCCKITDSTIIKVAKACPHLQILHINQCTKITDHGIEVLADQCPRLTQLLMDHCSQVTEKGLEAIVRGCPYMTYLNIMSCGVTDRGVKLLANLTNLTNLDLSNILRLTPDAVIYLSRHCKNLDCINISLNSVMNDQCVTELAKNLPKLKRLYCVSCNISDEGLEKIAEFRPSLEALDVGWCQDITDHGVSVISNSCPHLDYFGLIRCDQVSIETVEELVLKFPRVNYSTFVLESRRLLERAQREGFMFGVPTNKS